MDAPYLERGTVAKKNKKKRSSCRSSNLPERGERRTRGKENQNALKGKKKNGGITQEGKRGPSLSQT